MELFHNAPATPPAPGSCDGRSRNRRIRTHWRQLPRLRGAKVTKQVRAGEKMRQEGYSKSGRNIIRNGHISGREAITSGEASPTGRHKKKRPVRVFLPYRGNAVHRITHPASRGVLHICGTSWNQAEIPHSEGSFPIANEAAFPHHLEDPGASRGLTPPRFSPSSGKRMSIGWAKTKRAPAV